MPAAADTNRMESRATFVRFSKSSVFIEQSTSIEPRYCCFLEKKKKKERDNNNKNKTL